MVTKFFIRNLFSWRHFDVSSLRLLSKFNSDVIMWYFSVKHKLQDLPPGLNGSAWSSMLHIRIGSSLTLLKKRFFMFVPSIFESFLSKSDVIMFLFLLMGFYDANINEICSEAFSIKWIVCNCIIY